jgi:hypothetical protein
MSGARILSRERIIEFHANHLLSTPHYWIGVLVREHDAALRELVYSLADYISGACCTPDCRECDHDTEAQTAQHDADCDLGKLLARARAVLEVGNG